MRLSFCRNKAFAEVDNLPGCSQVAVVHSAFVSVRYRGQGIGAQAHADRIGKVGDLGYDLMVCTCDEANTAQIKILEGFGWQRAVRFKSSKTGHVVALWTRSVSGLVMEGADG